MTTEEKIKVRDYSDELSGERYRRLLQHAVSVTGVDSESCEINTDHGRVTLICTAKTKVRERALAREVGEAVEKLSLHANSILAGKLAMAYGDANVYRARKDSALTERNTLVALLARLALSAGLNAGRRQHEDVPGEEWDPEWRTLVAIDLPTGQVSWHFHDRDAHLVADLPEYKGKWDGHDTAEKYRRVGACASLEAER